MITRRGMGARARTSARGNVLSCRVQITGARAGRPTPEAERQQDVAVLDVFENAASVKVVAATWIGYLHMVKWNGRWMIVNVLWEMKHGCPFTPW